MSLGGYGKKNICAEYTPLSSSDVLNRDWGANVDNDVNN